MKRTILITAAMLFASIASAQFRPEPVEPLPEGFKPASTNTFISEYPGVNAETREAIFRVKAPTAQNVQVDIGGEKYDMTKDENGVWKGICDPQVVGFH